MKKMGFGRCMDLDLHKNHSTAKSLNNEFEGIKHRCSLLPIPIIALMSNKRNTYEEF